MQKGPKEQTVEGLDSKVSLSPGFLNLNKKLSEDPRFIEALAKEKEKAENKKRWDIDEQRATYHPARSHKTPPRPKDWIPEEDLTCLKNDKNGLKNKKA